MRRILLISILLAGCLTTPEPSLGPEPVQPGPAEVRFAEAEAGEIEFSVETPMEQLYSAAEPNIARLTDGTLFITAPVGYQSYPNYLQGAAYLWRSTDDGTSWQVVRQPNLVDPPSAEALGSPTVGFSCSCDADVVTSPDDWVYYTDWYSSLIAGNFVVERSRDGGNTWDSATAPVPEHTIAQIDRQWLVAGDDGLLGLVYSFFSDDPALCCTQKIVGTFSSDHGETWSEAVDVVPVQNGWTWQIGHPSIHHDGTIMMAYGAVQSIDSFWYDPSEVRVAMSTDNGGSWSHQTIASVPEGFGNLWAVQGASGTNISTIAWAAIDGDMSHVYVSSSTDLMAWSAPLQISPNGTHVLPWVTVADVPYVVWYGGESLGDPDEATNGEWHLFMSRVENGASTFQVTTQPVKTGPFCPRGAACTGDRELLDYASIVGAPDGTMKIAFARSSDGGGASIDGGQVHFIQAGAIGS